MRKIINKKHLPDNIRAFDVDKQINLDAITLETREGDLLIRETQETYKCVYPYYPIKDDETFIAITASGKTGQYFYTKVGSSLSEFNRNTAFPDGVNAKFNKRTLVLDLPEVSESKTIYIFIDEIDGWDIEFSNTNINYYDKEKSLTLKGQCLQLIGDTDSWNVISDRKIGLEESLKVNFAQTLINKSPKLNHYSQMGNLPESLTTKKWVEDALGVEKPNIKVDNVVNSVLNVESDTYAGIEYFLDIIITNIGNADLTIENPNIGLITNAVITTQGTLLDSTLTPNQSTTLTIGITPIIIDNWSMEMSIDNNTEDNNPYVLNIIGDAVNIPLITLYIPEVKNNRVHSVGYKGTGTGNEVTYTLKSIGTNALDISDIQILNTSNCSVTITESPSSNIPSGTNDLLVLNIIPTELGAFSFDVSISNSDIKNSPYYWTVAGTGTVANINYWGNGSDGDLIGESRTLNTATNYDMCVGNFRNVTLNQNDVLNVRDAGGFIFINGDLTVTGNGKIKFSNAFNANTNYPIGQLSIPVLDAEGSDTGTAVLDIAGEQINDEAQFPTLDGNGTIIQTQALGGSSGAAADGGAGASGGAGGSSGITFTGGLKLLAGKGAGGGGGGGGNGANGDDGRTNGSGGYGGGAGPDGGDGGNGGTGGGAAGTLIIFVKGTITGTINIEAKGAKGSSGGAGSNGTYGGAGGGAGSHSAGGAIIFISRQSEVDTNFDVSGGTGTSAGGTGASIGGESGDDYTGTAPSGYIITKTGVN